MLFSSSEHFFGKKCSSVGNCFGHFSKVPRRLGGSRRHSSEVVPCPVTCVSCPGECVMLIDDSDTQMHVRAVPSRVVPVWGSSPPKPPTHTHTHAHTHTHNEPPAHPPIGQTHHTCLIVSLESVCGHRLDNNVSRVIGI